MLVHKGIKRFKCKIFSQQFRQNSNFKQHVMTVHEVVKPFECQICSSKFGLKNWKITFKQFMTMSSLLHVKYVFLNLDKTLTLRDMFCQFTKIENLFTVKFV
jgi:hypothetical protein